MGVSAGDVLRMRLAAQLVQPMGSGDVAAVVRHLLAIQAQDFGQALWAVGARTSAAGRSDVLGALARGEVVRALPMRGTLHFVAAEDLRWMLALTARRSLQSAATRFATLGLDRATLDAAESVTRRALEGGAALSRDEYLKRLAASGIDPSGQRGYHIIFYLTQLALVCWGPPTGTQQALVLVDEWIPPTPNLDHQAAIEQFALRYFASHGPATERDFAWWAKLTLRDVRDAIAGLGDRLARITLNGDQYYCAPSAADGVARAASRGIQLLPGFDEYLLAYQDRSLALETAYFERIVPGNNGIFRPIIVRNGRVAGTWSRNPKTHAVEPDHFEDASAAQLAGVARAGRRFEKFLAT